MAERDWGYESLDYDVVESSLNKVYMRDQTDEVSSSSLTQLISHSPLSLSRTH